jgi:hypothetical protein
MSDTAQTMPANDTLTSFLVMGEKSGVYLGTEGESAD